jgi:hypothetical protein
MWAEDKPLPDAPTPQQVTSVPNYSPGFAERHKTAFWTTGVGVLVTGILIGTLETHASNSGSNSCKIAYPMVITRQPVVTGTCVTERK